MEIKLLKLSEINDKIPIPKDFNDLRNLTEICKFFKNFDSNKNNKISNENGNIRQYIKGVIETYFIKTSMQWKDVLSENDLKIFKENSFELFKDYEDDLKENPRNWFRYYEFVNRIFYIRIQNENKFICLHNSFSCGQILFDRFIIKNSCILFLTNNIFLKNKKFHNQLNKFSINLLDFSVNLEQQTNIVDDYDDCGVYNDTEFIKEFLHLGQREMIQHF